MRITATILIGFVTIGLAHYVVAAELPKEVEKLASWRLADVNGDVVEFTPQPGAGHRVLFFWATWCPYCKALMPHLEAFRRDKLKHDIAFYALNIWEDGDPKAYVSNHDFNFRLILKADAIAEQYGIKGTPGVILVNENNEVLYQRKSGTPPEQVIADLNFALSNGN